jgi:hypothetical protein
MNPMFSHYKTELNKLTNNKDYRAAFDFLMRLIPNLSVNELEELSEYYIHLLYLQNYCIRSRL